MVLGGIDANGRKLDSIEIYDPLQDTWATERNFQLGAPTAGFSALANG